MNCSNDRFPIVATTTWLDPGSCQVLRSAIALIGLVYQKLVSPVRRGRHPRASPKKSSPLRTEAETRPDTSTRNMAAVVSVEAAGYVDAAAVLPFARLGTVAG